MPITSNKKNLPRRTKEYVLPSAGFEYEGMVPEGKVKIRSFNFETEQVMMDDSLSPQERLNKLTMAVWEMPPEFELGLLMQYDQLYMLMAAWDMSTGKSYELKTTCPKCNHNEKHMFNLPDGLKVNRLTSKEPTVVILPDSEDKVVIQFPTVARGDEVTAQAKIHKNVLKQGEADYILNIASNIATVNGTAPDTLDEALEYVKCLEGPDVPALRKAISNRPGVDRNIPVICENCDHHFNSMINLDAEFFLPQSKEK